MASTRVTGRHSVGRRLVSRPALPPVSPETGRTEVNDRALVNLRCSAVVFRADAVLLCQRSSGEWVLPGGTPQHGEGSAACVLREVREETGLLVDPWRVAFVLEDRKTTRLNSSHPSISYA